jgi:hypothetical protein
MTYYGSDHEGGVEDGDFEHFVSESRTFSQGDPGSMQSTLIPPEASRATASHLWR